MSNKIQIIVGSTRPNRIGHQIGEWLKTEIDKQEGINSEVIDLATVDLPFLDEAIHPSMNKYANDHTKAWSEKIKEGSAYIWLTPEYNAGYSAPIKNAIDYLHGEWVDKPVLVASYGAGGGASANNQLSEVAKRLRTKLVEPSISFVTPTTPDIRDENSLIKDVEATLGANKDAVTASLTALVDLAKV